MCLVSGKIHPKGKQPTDAWLLTTTKVSDRCKPLAKSVSCQDYSWVPWLQSEKQMEKQVRPSVAVPPHPPPPRGMLYVCIRRCAYGTVRVWHVCLRWACVWSRSVVGPRFRLTIGGRCCAEARRITRLRLQLAASLSVLLC